MSKADELRAFREARAGKKPAVASSPDSKKKVEKNAIKPTAATKAARGCSVAAGKTRKLPAAKAVTRANPSQSKPKLEARKNVPSSARDVAVKPAGEMKRGRPKIEGERPWEKAGLSRRSWYRRERGK